MDDRLDSWKSIANYLRRGVRTVQRWERQEGLPVHRLEHDSKATVFAFKSELDAWWANGRSQSAGGRPAQPSRIPVRQLSAGALAVLIVAAAVAWLWPTSPQLNFQERDWVLVAALENGTGEAIFDGTVEYVLERELANSRFVNVVPRERVQDSLRLMKLAPDSPLEPTLAREVALRDGGIRAFVAGRIEKLDSTYLLSLSLIDPADGVTVAAFSGEAKGHAEVISTVRGLSNRLRRSLGENLVRIQASKEALEKVTTPSLQALNYYTLGKRLVDAHQFEAAIEFFERAVEEDPDFASAHILLAHCHSNANRTEVAASHYVRAFELADATMDPERYFIRGSYYDRYRKDHEKAVLAYKALLEIQPDHYWGHNNLAHNYGLLGQPQRAMQHVIATARLRPNDFLLNYFAADLLSLWHADPDLIDEFAGRLGQLISQGDADQPWRLQILNIRMAWFRGERENALHQLDEMVHEIEALPKIERSRLQLAVTRAAATYLAIGRLYRAEELLNSMALERGDLINLGLATQRPELVLDQLRDEPAHFGVVPLLVKIDQLDMAEAVFAELLAPDYDPPDAWYPGLEYMQEAARGALAFGHGETAEAIVHLTEALRILPPFPWGLRYPFDDVELIAADLLAQAWQAKGDLTRAAEALRLPVPEGGAPYPLESSTLTAMNNELKLAAIYRSLGNVMEAQRIEAELRDWLAYADPDHPIVTAISR